MYDVLLMVTEVLIISFLCYKGIHAMVVYEDNKSLVTMLTFVLLIVGATVAYLET